MKYTYEHYVRMYTHTCKCVGLLCVGIGIGMICSIRVCLGLGICLGLHLGLDLGLGLGSGPGINIGFRKPGTVSTESVDST